MICDRCKTRPADEPTITRGVTRRSTGEVVELCFPCQEIIRDRLLAPAFARLRILPSRPQPPAQIPGQLELDLSGEER